MAPEEEALAYGTLVTSRDVLIVPDHNWSAPSEGRSPGPKAEAGQPAWQFRSGASVLVVLQASSAEPLAVTFRPTKESVDYRFRVQWDEEILEESTPAGDGLEVLLPADRLAAGRHELKLTRVHQQPKDGDDNTFESIEYRLGGDGRELEPRRLPSYRLAADFLQVGVAGNGHQKFGGILFWGPGDRRGTLRFEEGANVQVRAQNLSTAPARFGLSIDGERHTAELAPGAAQVFRLPVAAGKRFLRLTAEGEEQGVFLWGEPYLERPADRTGALPPVFLLTLDTTRRDALDVYTEPGSEEAERAPHLAAFARHATVYERAYSTAPWTLPSHASIMTGLFPSNHGAGVTRQFLPGSMPTLAGLLRERGYYTAGFAGGHLCSHGFGVGQGFATYRNPDGFETLGDQMTNYLIAFLDLYHRRPLFVFANYFDPHALYRAPEEFEQRFDLEGHREALEGHPLWQAFDRGDSRAWRKIIDGEAEAPPEVLDYVRAGYRSEVAFMDAQLGRLFENLERHNLFDRALIILVADHGELLGEYGGLFSHAGRLDPELTEIPLIVKWPGQREGERVADLVSQVDLFSTILRAAGLDVPPNDGRPLPRANTGAGSDGSRLVFLEEHESRVHPLPKGLYLGPHVYGLQRGDRRQIVWDSGGECAVREGGGWRTETCQEEPSQVFTAVERRLGEKEEVRDAGALSPEQQEALKALGYL